jgi:hypothetical protein
LSLHLYFREEGQGKERGLYPPSSWSKRIQGVGASFRLEIVNQGVIASFYLEIEKAGSQIFLQVGACKIGGWRVLLVVA